MEPSMEWSMMDTLELIDRYREHEVLWDTNHVNYKLAPEREAAWNELAALFRTTPFQVKRKIKSLLASYRRERVKLHKLGAKAEDSKWFAFERLGFMRDIYTPRKAHVENGGEKGDVDLMAELLDVSFREGAAYLEDGTESDDRSCQGVESGVDYEAAASNVNGNPTVNGSHPVSFPRKRKKAEEPQPLFERFNPYIWDHYPRRDEFAVYGEHIANELRHLDRHTLCKVKHLINNIIYEAQMVCPDVDSTEPAAKRPRDASWYRYPDSGIASPSSTNPSASGVRLRRETTDDSELDEDALSVGRVEFREKP